MNNTKSKDNFPYSYNSSYPYFKMHLMSKGIADTRLDNLASSVDDLHKALCACDLENRAIFFKTFPSVKVLLNVFGHTEELESNF